MHFRCDRNRNEGGVACYLKADLCFKLTSTVMGDIEDIFLDILLSEKKPVFVGLSFSFYQLISVSWNVLIKIWMTSTLIMKYF